VVEILAKAYKKSEYMLQKECQGFFNTPPKKFGIALLFIFYPKP
jgi:hypothetical protein